MLNNKEIFSNVEIGRAYTVGKVMRRTIQQAEEHSIWTCGSSKVMKVI